MVLCEKSPLYLDWQPCILACRPVASSAMDTINQQGCRQIHWRGRGQGVHRQDGWRGHVASTRYNRPWRAPDMAYGGGEGVLHHSSVPHAWSRAMVLLRLSPTYRVGRVQKGLYRSRILSPPSTSFPLASIASSSPPCHNHPPPASATARFTR